MSMFKLKNPNAARYLRESAPTVSMQIGPTWAEHHISMVLELASLEAPMDRAVAEHRLRHGISWSDAQEWERSGPRGEPTAEEIDELALDIIWEDLHTRIGIAAVRSAPSSKERTAQRLKDRRALARLTQAQLAELAGLGEATVKKIEQGSVSPTVETLGKLASILACDVAELV